MQFCAKSLVALGNLTIIIVNYTPKAALITRDNVYTEHIPVGHTAVAAPAFHEWGGQGGQDMCKGSHTFLILFFNPPSLSSLYSSSYPICTFRLTTLPST